MEMKSAKYMEATESTNYTKSTTIRINQLTKDKLETLDFVRKNTFDQILNHLIDFYEENKRGKRK